MDMEVPLPSISPLRIPFKHLNAKQTMTKHQDCKSSSIFLFPTLLGGEWYRERKEDTRAVFFLLHRMFVGHTVAPFISAQLQGTRQPASTLFQLRPILPFRQRRRGSVAHCPLCMRKVVPALTLEEGGRRGSLCSSFFCFSLLQRRPRIPHPPPTLEFPREILVKQSQKSFHIIFHGRGWEGSQPRPLGS